MSRLFAKICSFLLVTVLLMGVFVAVPQQSVKALSIDVKSYLASISGNHTVSGQHNKEPNTNPTQYTDIAHSITGQYPGLWGGDFLFASSDINARQTMINEAKNEWNAGSLVALTWHACAPTVGEPCAWTGGVVTSLSNTDWTNLTTPGTALYNTWKARLDKIVPFLTDLKNSGVQVLWRPFHEMNQGVFWWGGRTGASGTLKLYQQEHDYFNSLGLTNLVWVWDVQDLSTDFSSYSPGCNYFDVAALDVYNSDLYTSVKYNLIQSVSCGKPIALGEVGVLPSPSVLASQPKWVYFMDWADLLQSDNSNAAIQSLYADPQVINRGGIVGGSSPTNTPIISGEAPFGGTRWNLPGQVEAENYDTGGQNVGYSKPTAGTSTLSYRGDENAQIETTGDTGGGADVGWTNTNDWYKYMVNVTSSGSYSLNFRVSSANTGSTFHLEVDGNNVTGSMTVPNTGGWQTYQTLTSTGVSLSAGQHTLRLFVDNGGMNFNWFSVSGGGGTSPTNTPTFVPPTPVPTATPIGPNLAYNRPADASSSENTTNTPDKAVDANGNTRWSSAYADPQWLRIDLGSNQSISHVKLQWETAYGRYYQIQTSTDNVNWTTVYTNSAGQGGVEDIYFSATTARWVKMYGIQRATAWGYSLWEFEVYH